MELAFGQPPFDLASYDTWDTFPPQQGRIRLTSERGPGLVAEGGFRVMLSYGPGPTYTWAWAIERYEANGVPVVPRGFGIDTAVRRDVSRAEAATEAATLAEVGSGGFGLWCGDLLLEVSDLAPALHEPAAGQAVREQALAAAVQAAVEPEDREMSDAERAVLYESIQRLAPSEAARLALVFVLAEADDELEASRTEVGPGDVDVLARAYWLLPTWGLRTALAYVLQDSDDPALVDLRFDVLHAPPENHFGVRTIAQAASLAWLRGDIAAMDAYLDDVDRLRNDAALWASLRN